VRLLLRLAVAAALLAVLYAAGRSLLSGGERDRRIRLLDARSRLLDLRLSVLHFEHNRGMLPGMLEDTQTVRGGEVPARTFQFQRERGQRAVDPWNESLRYERNPDGAAFTLRSAGPDGRWDTPDDLVSEGRAGEDRAPLQAELKEVTAEYLKLVNEKSRRKRKDWSDR
jgi:hypothetical protein